MRSRSLGCSAALRPCCRQLLETVLNLVCELELFIGGGCSHNALVDTRRVESLVWSQHMHRTHTPRCPNYKSGGLHDLWFFWAWTPLARLSPLSRVEQLLELLDLAGLSSSQAGPLIGATFAALVQRPFLPEKGKAPGGGKLQLMRLWVSVFVLGCVLAVLWGSMEIV